MIDFKIDMDSTGLVMHDLITASLKGGHISHEWYFTRALYQQELYLNPKLADAFAMFVFQYYPNYKFAFDANGDYLKTVVYEAYMHDHDFQDTYYGYEFKEEHLERMVTFGEIATDFMIRYRNYSLVKCCGQNIILTAQSDCHKRFESLLSKGYSLQRRAKVGYIEKPAFLADWNPLVKGLFYKLHVLPTRDIGYPIDEIIETGDGSYVLVM